MLSQSLTDQDYPYDVALSFAGEDRIHAEALAEALRLHGIRVFYDKYEKNILWGKDLYTHLSDLYQNKARYCVMFFSQYYVAKTWTKHELRAAQARAFKEQQEYILPIRLDDAEIPGILPTTAYLTWEGETVDTIVDAILKKLGNTSRKSVNGWLKESQEYDEKGLYEKARIACEQAIKIDPYHSDSYHDYGWILRKLERFEESFEAFEQAIQFNMKDDIHYTLDLYRQKGSTLEALKRYEEALIVYEQVIQFGKTKVAYSQFFYYYDYYFGDLCNIGDALLGLERYEDALTVYEQAFQLASNSTSSDDSKRTRALANKGYTLFLLDRYEEALVICDQVIQLTPKDFFAYRQKGDILDKLKHYEEALSFFDKAVDLNPKDAYACRRKGDLLYQLKHHAEALAACEQAIQLDSTNPYAHITKSNVLIALGQIEAAYDEHLLVERLNYNDRS
ncbi:MAG TPA: tetratricopeptide repeat protein [Methylomirabilota bacterium]|nr:tetratricopeptide repeat protein [Methylomirabilota bacterium]